LVAEAAPAVALKLDLLYNLRFKCETLSTMFIHFITTKATSEQMAEMLVELETYVKLAVDVRLGVLAGGGELHADCEANLLENGSKQDDIWGADWFPHSEETTFESMINIRPGQGNFSMEVQSEDLRLEIRKVAENLLGGVAIG